MKIFTDLHHGDLYYSLHLLFEKRLGYELFRPIGYEWYHEGYWKIGDPYPKPFNTAKQYLDLKKGRFDPYTCLNGEHYIEDDIYYVFIPGHNYYQKAITLNKFKSMHFDIIMPTFPGHDRPFETLRNYFHPKAKIIMQMGNIGQRTHLPNVLHSCAYTRPLSHQHCLRYHQEINPDLFEYTDPPIGTKNIYSVVNLSPYLKIYNTYKKLISDANWKYYGSGSPDGPLSGARGVSEKMKEANIAWHLKPGGGVGHSTKGWMSIGRPMVTNMSQHRKAGGDSLALFEPGITCIDLDSGTTHENERLIRNLLDPEENLKWCNRVSRRFKDIVNYDVQEQEIRRFMEELV